MTLQITIHNVGHGHAVHAITPNAQSIVIDLGRSDEFSPLRCLRNKTQTIDNLIISHPHGDHIDEILELENLGFNVRQIWRPKWLSDEDVRSANQSNYSEKLNCYFDISNTRFTSPVEEEERVGNPAVSGGVSISIYASSECGTSNINNHSGITVFEYNGVKVVIPGDNEPPSWNSLMEESSFIEAIKDADVFMASHHGRESGYHSDLLNTINPKLCIVSDGRVQNTDATSRYSAHASGWSVHKKSTGEWNDRKCLTTRTDGNVDIVIGKNSDGNPYLSINID